MKVKFECELYESSRMDNRVYKTSHYFLSRRVKMVNEIILIYDTGFHSPFCLHHNSTTLGSLIQRTCKSSLPA